jgi:hypothetical protein
MIAQPPEVLSFQRELTRRAMEAEAALLFHSGVGR